MRRERLPRATQRTYEWNGQSPGQLYALGNWQSAFKHGQKRGNRETVGGRLRTDAYRLLSGREQSLEDMRQKASVSMLSHFKSRAGYLVRWTLASACVL